jgi:hypothetical protein
MPTLFFVLYTIGYCALNIYTDARRAALPEKMSSIWQNSSKKVALPKISNSGKIEVSKPPIRGFYYECFAFTANRLTILARLPVPAI